MKIYYIIPKGTTICTGDLYFSCDIGEFLPTTVAATKATTDYLRPMKKSELKKYFSTLGKKKSPAKAAAAKANGAKGGRKPKHKPSMEDGQFST